MVVWYYYHKDWDNHYLSFTKIAPDTEDANDESAKQDYSGEYYQHFNKEKDHFDILTDGEEVVMTEGGSSKP